ncbi:MAG: transglutaminaseTgpA domain-containing protein [Pirellulales bacterium]
MDLQRVKRLRRILTLHFSVIAFITAILVANNGSGDIFLPSLMFLVCTSAFVLVDWLEVFYLGKVGSYIGMAVATIIALVSLAFSAFSGIESRELMSVASLLIYPQCVLFFQKKSLRVFEQLAIFLLLQMIVAALINDNILYGALLTPMMLAWVSSLVLFARYSTLVQLFPDIEEPVPLLYELIYRKFVQPVMANRQPNGLVTTETVLDDSILEVARQRRWLVSAPLGLAALLFAGGLFYFLPRTGQGTSLATLSFQKSGISDRINTNFFGRLIMDPTPVFRLTFSKDGEAFRPNDAPYLRMEVFDQYRPPMRDRSPGNWFRSNNFPIRPKYKLAPETEFPKRDIVRVEIKSKENSSRIGSRLMVSVPPIAKVGQEFIYDRNIMIFEQIGEEHKYAPKKTMHYSYLTAAFADSNQIKITPDHFPAFFDQLTSLSVPLPETNAIREQILKNAGITAITSRFQAARAIERHFRYSKEYTYSLNVPPLMETQIDPIDDFVANTKCGICQHYASAMVAMLRQSGIPSRIVIGYHPKEYNKRTKSFLVRNSDAHAWVEAQIPREDLLKTEFAKYLTDAEHYWLLLDPTPVFDDGDGVTEQSNALEYAEDLWDDYISNPNSNAMANSYAPMADAGRDSAARFLDWLKRIKVIVIDEWFRNLSFAWQLTALVMLFGGGPVLIWQLIRTIKRFAPNLAVRLGLIKQQVVIKQKFYARCMALLESLRIRRPESETTREFSDRAYDSIHSKAPEPGTLRSALDTLGELYYRLRFGRADSIDSAIDSQVEQHLQAVEVAVKTAKRGS